MSYSYYGEVCRSKKRFLKSSSCFAWLLKIFVLVIVFKSSRCLPVTKEDINVVDYLADYGYLSTSDILTRNLQTGDQLIDAIKSLQKFGNIPATGEIDAKTKELLRTPRCGLRDYPLSRRKRYALIGVKWRQTHLTWNLGRVIPNLDKNQVRSAIHQALNVWSSNSNVAFTETNSKDADILVSFERGDHEDGSPFDGKGLVLAHGFYPETQLAGDAHFDADEEWGVNLPRKYDGSKNLFEVAAHEFGHSLGLNHSSVRGSLMFPWYQGLSDKLESFTDFQLPDDDREGIQRLYGNRAPGTSTIKPYSVTKTTQSPPTRSTVIRTTEYEKSRPLPDQIPNTCHTTYDAVSMIRGELFIFKDKYVWRIGNSGLREGYPTRITRLWNQLPTNLTHVDAVYERCDSKIVFFLGQEVFMFEGNRLIREYPKPLTSLGLPRNLTHIDAATIWGSNNKTYFFNGASFWRLNDEVGRVEKDYPRDIKRVWKGIDYNIDAAFQWRDGVTYFFKGYGFWTFLDKKMNVKHPHQELSAPRWMGCPNSASRPS